MQNQLKSITSSPYSAIFNIKFSHKDSKLPYSLEDFERFQKFHIEKTNLKRFSMMISQTGTIPYKKTQLNDLSFLPTMNKKKMQLLNAATTTQEVVPLPATDPVSLANANLLIDAIETAIHAAQDENSALIVILSPVLQALNNLKAIMPNPTEDDLNQLYGLATLPSESLLAKYLTPAQQTTYRSTIGQAIQKMIQNLTAAQDDTEKNFKAKQDHLDFLSNCQGNIFGLLTQTQSLLTNGSARYTASSTLNSLTLEALYSTLGESFSRLSSSEQNSISLYLQDLLLTRITTTSASIPTGTVAEVIGAMAVYQETALYIFSHPYAKTPDLKTHLLNTFVPPIRAYPSGNLIANAMVYIINSKFEGNVVTTNASDSVANLIPNFPATVMEAAFKNSIDGASYQKLTDITEKYQLAFATANSALQKEIDQLKNYYNILDPANATFLDENLTVKTQLIDSQNVGAALIRMVLDTYLPQQNIFLQPLIDQINLNNFGAEVLNKVIKITNPFSSSGTYYNFSSNLIQSNKGTDLFAGDYAEVIMANVSARQRIQSDLSRSEQASKQIDLALQEVQNFPGLSDFDKENIRIVLLKYQYFFTTINKQLINLNSILGDLDIRPDSEANVFKITSSTPDWMDLISNLEGAATSGYTDTYPAGGLSTIFTQAQSDQQSYTNQSQTQQLNLQNQMTTIQQEWTIISTSLQIFNQVLMKLANQISPS